MAPAKSTRSAMVGNLEELIKPYLETEIFSEVLELARQNSEGKIWLMGGFLYKNIAAALYGGETYTKDIDLIVEKRNVSLKQVPNWIIETNSYGVANYTRLDCKMSMTDIRKAIRVSNMVNPTVEEFIEETPLNIQSIALDLDKKVLIGKRGIDALNKRVVKVNNLPQAKYYAERKRKSLETIIIEKANELNFEYELP